MRVVDDVDLEVEQRDAVAARAVSSIPPTRRKSLRSRTPSDIVLGRESMTATRYPTRTTNDLLRER